MIICGLMDWKIIRRIACFLDFRFEALCWGGKKIICNRERQRVVVE